MFDLNKAEEILDRLKAYPNILKKLEAMLDLIEKNKVESADDFEEALIPEVRGFGKEITQTRASFEESFLRESLERDGIAHHSKKNSTGKLPLEK